MFSIVGSEPNYWKLSKNEFSQILAVSLTCTNFFGTFFSETHN